MKRVKPDGSTEEIDLEKILPINVIGKVEKNSCELDKLIAEKVGYLLCQCENKFDPNHPRFSDTAKGAFLLRKLMQDKGWTSEDRMSWMGWGAPTEKPWGYSVWFRKYGNRQSGARPFCGHASARCANESEMAEVTAAAALAALSIKIPKDQQDD